MGRGHMRERSPGVWALTWEAPRGPDGKRRQGTATVRGTERQAQRELNRRLYEAEQAASAADPGRLTVADLLDRWLAAARPKLAPTSVQLYEAQLRLHLKPALGALRLSRLVPLQIQDHYTAELGRGAAPASVALQHAILRRACRQAVRWGLLDRNPCEGVDPPAAVPPALTVLDASALRALFRAAGPELRPAVVLAVLSGLRRGELLGLKAADVDREAGTLTVQRNLYHTRAGGVAFGPPKTRAGTRTLTLSGLALDALAAQAAAVAARKAAFGPLWEEQGLLFPGEAGRPWHPQAFTSAFRRLIRRHGLPEVRFHDLRHSNISISAALGIPLKVISARAGHANPALTLNRYQHLLPGQDQDAAARLDAAFRDDGEAAA